MVTRLDSLSEIAPRYGAVVLDQWGVLHDGTRAYPAAPDGLAALKAAGVRLAVLSNSGKRAAPNAARIAAMGFDAAAFETVMTSGEALWRDIASGHVPERRFCPVERAPGDAADWAEGLNLTLTAMPAEAEAILLMGIPDGLPDGPEARHNRDLFGAARDLGLTVYCTNPDRASPRSAGVTVTSPGALAHAHAAAGGAVRFYGKPHLPVFRAIEAALDLPPERILMVGDSLEHDIAGAKAAGWDAAFVEGGLHAAAFAASDAPEAILTRLTRAESVPLPEYTLPELR